MYIYDKVFIFYSHLKMASERSKRRDLLACIFMANNYYNYLPVNMYFNAQGSRV